MFVFKELSDMIIIPGEVTVTNCIVIDFIDKTGDEGK